MASTTKIYRGMQEAQDGYPVVGTDNGRKLGARPGLDIPITPWGAVQPQTGGMSVSPDDPLYLPDHRRPPAFGGTGSDPVWWMDLDDLPPSLAYRADPDPAASQYHGFVEPAAPVALASYQQALASTRPHWRKETRVTSPKGSDVTDQPVPPAFYEALDATDTIGALRTAVEAELRDNIRRADSTDDAYVQVYRQLEVLRDQLREEHDAREDAVLDVMDFLWGWCSPHARILVSG